MKGSILKGAVLVGILCFVLSTCNLSTEQDAEVGVKGEFVFMNSSAYQPTFNISAQGHDEDGYVVEKQITIDDSLHFFLKLPKGTYRISVSHGVFVGSVQPPSHWRLCFDLPAYIGIPPRNSLTIDNQVINAVYDLGEIPTYFLAEYYLNLDEQQGVIVSENECIVTSTKTESDFFVEQHSFSPAISCAVYSKNGLIDVSNTGIQFTTFMDETDYYLFTPPETGYSNTFQCFEQTSYSIYGNRGVRWSVKTIDSYAKVIMKDRASSLTINGFETNYVVQFIWGTKKFLVACPLQH